MFPGTLSSTCVPPDAPAAIRSRAPIRSALSRMPAEWRVRNAPSGRGGMNRYDVRNRDDEMVPLSALTRFESRNGPEFTLRFNEYRSAQLNGGAAPGYSSNQAMKALEETFAETMPPQMGYDYSGISFQEKKAAEGVSSSVIFGFSLLFVFLILPRSTRAGRFHSAFCSVRRLRCSAPSECCGYAAPFWA